MIRLKIKNLILIEEADIFFGSGLNILTGETGSGKSAILTAVKLLAGGRADTNAIRQGAEFAFVEALIAPDIWVRREIYRSGKNRCFVDDAQVSLAALKEVVGIELVDASCDELALLDQFAHLEISLTALRQKKEEEKRLLSLDIDKLEEAKQALAFLNESHILPDEEEKLAEEHTRLIHSQELLEKVGTAIASIEERLDGLKRCFGVLEQCTRKDATLKGPAEALKASVLELEEVDRELHAYVEQIDTDPSRLSYIEKRLGVIETLKRRFGQDLAKKKEELSADILHLTDLAEKKKGLSILQDEIGQLETSITKIRKEKAPLLASKVLKELHDLNMPHAQFDIAVQDRFGQVQFLFSANPGVPLMPLKTAPSGGELARLLLSIKTILAEGNSTLVFDEIDSNIGGKTAAILGEKLRKLGLKRQIVCVTHFVQVAKCALDHFLVQKTLKDGASYTSITKLDEQEKGIEYNRMLGCQ